MGSLADFIDTLGKDFKAPEKPVKPPVCAREPYVPEPAFYRLPAKSMSWQYDDGAGGKHTHRGAVIIYNKTRRGRIEWNEQTQSFDAWVIIRMRRNNGRVDQIEAAVTGLDTKDAAGRQVTSQWFRRAAKLGWIG